MELLVVLGLSALTISLLSIWEGFVFMKMWAWFVVPAFGLPMVTIPMAIGLSLLVGLLTHQMRNDDDKSPVDNAVALFSHGFVNAGAVLIMGYVVTFFI